MTSLDSLALRQLRDYDTRNPGSMFAEGANLSIQEAYQLQAAVADLRRNRGEHHIGYKVGCTSPAIRAQLGIEHPVAGHLWESECCNTGRTLRLSDYVKPAIEGELAAELAGDLGGESLSDFEIVSAIGCLFPVIELHNAILRGDEPTAAELVANNALHAGFVAGTTRLPFRKLATAKLDIRVNGDIADAYEGPDLTSGIIRSLRWLAGHLARHGRSLCTGDVILAGSLPSLIPVTTEAEIRVQTSHFGQVAVRFVP